MDPCQSAYRSNCSTETALLKVTSDLCGSIDNGHVSMLVTLDISAAFDTIDSSILLKVYSFIEITSDIPHMFTIKVQVIRNTAHRPSTQASYTIGSGTTMQENLHAAQIAAKHSIIPQMAPYMS